jgi:hypothetical protein
MSSRLPPNARHHPSVAELDLLNQPTGGGADRLANRRLCGSANRAEPISARRCWECSSRPRSRNAATREGCFYTPGAVISARWLLYRLSSSAATPTCPSLLARGSSTVGQRGLTARSRGRFGANCCCFEGWTCAAGARPVPANRGARWRRLPNRRPHAAVSCSARRCCSEPNRARRLSKERQLLARADRQAARLGL